MSELIKGRVYKRNSKSIGDDVEIGDLGILLSEKVNRNDCCPFLMLTGNRKDEIVKLSLRCFNLIPLHTPYESTSIELESLEDFEIMKAIMHLHNKVADSSFFDLEFTPDSEEVREFMKRKFKELDAHHAGWSKYNK